MLRMPTFEESLNTIHQLFSLGVSKTRVLTRTRSFLMHRTLPLIHQVVQIPASQLASVPWRGFGAPATLYPAHASFFCSLEVFHKGAFGSNPPYVTREHSVDISDSFKGKRLLLLCLTARSMFFFGLDMSRLCDRGAFGLSENVLSYGGASGVSGRVSSSEGASGAI